MREGDEWVVNDNEQLNDAELRGRASGDRRRDITLSIERLGII
jgi:hypothetical protein